MKNKAIAVVKVISTVLITGVILLEAWDHFATASNVSGSLLFILGFGRIAVCAHLIEGIVAAAIAPSKQKSPIRYAVYTFFVGTVGLIELMDEDHLPGFLKTLQN